MIRIVQQASPQLSIRQLCDWLGVSRSWYYACSSVDEQAQQDVALRDAIEQVVLEFAGYGYRRVTHALRRVIHTFWLSRFNAILLSSLGFLAK